MQTVVPMLAYADGVAAMDWLQEASASRRSRGGSTRTASSPTASSDSATVSSCSRRRRPPTGDRRRTPRSARRRERWLEVPYVVDGVLVNVDDVDAHCRRARAAGARILSPPEDVPAAGIRHYRVEDLEGHRWRFARRLKRAYLLGCGPRAVRRGARAAALARSRGVAGGDPGDGRLARAPARRHDRPPNGGGRSSTSPWRRRRDRRDRSRRQVDLPRRLGSSSAIRSSTSPARQGREELRQRPRGAIIRTLAAFELTGRRIEGLTGVWLPPAGSRGPRKIASIGVRVSRWITTHGYALNVDLDPAPFTEWITACGLEDAAVHDDGARTRPAAHGRGGEPAAAEALSEVFELELDALAVDDGHGLWAQPVHERLGPLRPDHVSLDWIVETSLPVAERPRRPEWMKVRAPSTDGRYFDVKKLIHGAEPAHGLRGGSVPEHRRVLGPGHRDLPDPRRHLHPGLPLLLRPLGHARASA